MNAARLSLVKYPYKPSPLPCIVLTGNPECLDAPYSPTRIANCYSKSRNVQVFMQELQPKFLMHRDYIVTHNFLQNMHCDLRSTQTQTLKGIRYDFYIHTAMTILTSRNPRGNGSCGQKKCLRLGVLMDLQAACKV